MNELVQLCASLAFEACQIVKDCYQNNEVKKFDKGIDDPVTEADYKIQTMIVKGLTSKYKNIRIVG